ncbi:metal dependent phosphohydrolase [Isosphaera pallida ATCC 43644]|jgi:3'-5' exoribonuclease|uniref:Metal dependent phosphohydrolase n=1 Tax=Isosphaera pallida (strain ATCC 43644 / DSM 9630 / IS1B) TaxID=575540 RepID=E8R6H6_ISOPI|nr:HD domain-containing protein [Isosphaera pallida]ADV62887.1 metal dependent phosphohydrolase [Isosphaera pallida ATCC 43644]
MPRRSLADLAPGDLVDDVFLVASKQSRADRQGNLYLTLDLRDPTGNISARVWNVTKSLADSFESGDFLKVRAKAQYAQGITQLVVSHLEAVDPARLGLDPAAFLPKAPVSIAVLTSQLRGFLKSLDDPHLKALCDAFLMDDAFLADFTAVPAGVREHHAYQGGLLEHVVAMMTLASTVGELYPEVNRDLLLVGCFLHDVGKVRELSHQRGFDYTDEGQLVGHLSLGVSMVEEKLPLVQRLLGEPFPPETLLRIKHMILSHHGTLEFGSPKLPMTPEAVALHHLDALDSKLHAALREIRDDPDTASRWTRYDPKRNRRLFKGSAPPAAGEGEEDLD